MIFSDLQKIIQSIADISDVEISKLFEIGKMISVSRGGYFIREGEIPEKFGFVISGIFRYVYISEEGKQFTKGFMPEKSVISSYSAMVCKTSSFFYIEALENSQVFEIDYVKWCKLREADNCWDKFLIAMLEKGYMTKEKRERELLLLDAESRYKIFLQEFPDLEKRIKQHTIASYLGISSVALSRVRKKLGLLT